MRSYPWLIAHRGAMAEAPENVAAGFDIAFSYRIDGIETDVQLSSDGVPVIFHDDTLRRITGKKGTVADYPLAALQELDYGAWYAETFRGEAILTLEAFLRRYAGKGIFMIELKSEAGRQDPSAYRSRLCRAAAETIFHTVPENQHEKIFILSFDAGMVARTRELAPSLNYVLNLGKPVSRKASDDFLHGGLWGYGLAFRKLTAGFVRQCHEREKRVAVYSCNSPAEVSAVLEPGTDVVMTDDPGKVAPYFSDLRESVPAKSSFRGKIKANRQCNAGEGG